MRGGEFITGVKDKLLRLGDVEEEVTVFATLGKVGNGLLVTESLRVSIAVSSDYLKYFVMEEGLRQSLE